MLGLLDLFLQFIVQMAFYNKVGTLLRQSISSNSTLHGQVPMINAIRCMSTKLFIGGMCLKYLFRVIYQYSATDLYCAVLNVIPFLLIGLSYGTDDQSLRDAFSSFGDVVEGDLCVISCNLTLR